MKKIIIALVFLSSLSINAQDITGQWNGVLRVQGTQLRLVFTITKTANGFSTTMDSPDQGAKDIPVTTTTFDNSKLKLEITNARIEYNGELKENIITGILKQNGQEFPVNLSKGQIEKQAVTSSKEYKKTDFYTEDASLKNNKAKFKTTEIAVNPLLNGTLFTPEKLNKKTNLVILIAGSGPTNRNGNQPDAQNNSLKFLSEELTKNDIAVFSYDKRIIAQMIAGNINEKDLSFEDFITDAKTVISYFKSKKKYNKIIIAGHSEGALIGMVAANGNADGYISLDGPGRPIDTILIEQFSNRYPDLTKTVADNLAKLREGKTFEVASENPVLKSLFRESVQPYMISWIKYNPIAEIKKLKIPVLIINGTKDIQVQVLDAQLLKQAKPNAKLEIITNMNHIFKEVKTDDYPTNLATYSNPDLQIMPELVFVINKFVKIL